MKLTQLLHREVLPTIGCTEPIAVALCVARATKQLGVEPESITVSISKNIYKNALSVGIPNTGLTGLPIAIALGATIGDPDKELEVLASTTPEAVEYAKHFMERVPITINVDPNAPDMLYIHVMLLAGNLQTEATICGSHTGQTTEAAEDDYSALTLKQVYDYALTVPIGEVSFLLDGAKMNIKAAEYSFCHICGHHLGKLLNDKGYTDTINRILAYTSGACDARMSGAMVPVMSNSGSGNQGISCSVPVYIYAMDHHCSEELIIRALTLANMTAIYIKLSLGRLSALCGCVVAATGSAAGITYLQGGGYKEICYAINNMIANISGMICDGAKPGCALKVASGVTTALLSSTLAMAHSYADETEGIVDADIDQTIRNLTILGREGMKSTDEMILQIMVAKQHVSKH